MTLISPSTRSRQRPRPPKWLLVSAGGALLGVGVAGYLTVIHFNRDALVCGLGDCLAVQASRYAEVGGIPVAVLGLLLFLALLALGVARWLAPVVARYASPVAFALALAGVVYSGWLTWLEIAVIHAVCQWCVLSAVLTLVVFAAEARGLFRMLRQEFGPVNDDLAHQSP